MRRDEARSQDRWTNMRLAFRNARPDDLERLIDVHASAFPDARGRDARERNFTRNPLGRLSDLWVAVAPDAQDALVAHAFLFPLQAWFGRRLVAAGGIASVGVAPEGRGQGVATALVEHLHGVSCERGDSLTVLYPFRQAFYTRLGYAATTAYRRLRVSPASIPWAVEPPLRARPATGADRAAMQQCWDDAAARQTGMLARSARLWDSRFVEEARTWLVVEGATGPEGYVAWSLHQEQAHAATRLIVHEMAARTAAAKRSLWGLVGAQRGQVAEACVDTAADDLVERALVDADGARFGDAHVEHVLGEVAAGPLVRILDAPRALEARGYLAEGRLLIAAGDTNLELSVRDGRGSVAPAPRGEPQIRLDSRALAAVAFGALPVTQAERFGWAAVRDDHALALADTLFSLPAYFSPDPF
jgi:predicted acetyltransferase